MLKLIGIIGSMKIQAAVDGVMGGEVSWSEGRGCEGRGWNQCSGGGVRGGGKIEFRAW